MLLADRTLDFFVIVTLFLPAFKYKHGTYILIMYIMNVIEIDIHVCCIDVSLDCLAW